MYVKQVTASISGGILKKLELEKGKRGVSYSAIVKEALAEHYGSRCAAMTAVKARYAELGNALANAAE